MFCKKQFKSWHLWITGSFLIFHQPCLIRHTIERDHTGAIVKGYEYHVPKVLYISCLWDGCPLAKLFLHRLLHSHARNAVNKTYDVVFHRNLIWSYYKFFFELWLGILWSLQMRSVIWQLTTVIILESFCKQDQSGWLHYLGWWKFYFSNVMESIYGTDTCLTLHECMWMWEIQKSSGNFVWQL